MKRRSRLIIVAVIISMLVACDKPAEETVPTVTDVDGNVYQTITIGDQEWMAGNLRVMHYRNGEIIPNITNNFDWGGSSTGAYGVYNNDEEYAASYGLLYNGYVVDDIRNIAPEGWHVPTDDEWKELEVALGMSQSEADQYNKWRGTNEGSQLAGNRELWSDGLIKSNPEFGASGFNALPIGYRGYGPYLNGNYYPIGLSCYFWSSTESDSSYAWYRVLGSQQSEIMRLVIKKYNGLSIRCVKD